jgi:glucose-6-phosphate 1-dehydrogenase
MEEREICNLIPSAGPEWTRGPPARKADPCVMVIFGASGDLTKRKLIPACSIWPPPNCCRNNSPSSASPATIHHREFSQSTDRRHQTIRQLPGHAGDVELVPQAALLCARRFPGPRGFKRLKEPNCRGGKDPQRAGQPFLLPGGRAAFFGEVVRQLGAAGLAQEANGRWARVIIEKPFGRDLDSARALNARSSKSWRKADLPH